MERKIVIAVCALVLFIRFLMDHDELSRYKQEGRDNFKLLFPRELSMYSDDILSRLSHDYGLSDSEIERIARDGVHEAAAQYRKKHPLDHAPSDEIDFINVIPYK